MLSAKEASTIAKEANRFENELKEIESYIKNKAINGEYSVTLYPSMPYNPKTIIELKRCGYRVTSLFDEKKHHYSYCIEWGWGGLRWS